MQGTPAVNPGFILRFIFSMEDYFEDYFFRKITLRSKIVAESKITLKIVSKWEITLKITLRANNPQNSRGRCVHLYKTNFVPVPARSRGNLVPGNLVRGLVSTQGAWYGPGMLKGLPG